VDCFCGSFGIRLSTLFHCQCLELQPQLLGLANRARSHRTPQETVNMLPYIGIPNCCVLQWCCR
jgi:hypothetical protein